ncbi:hypothetical protein E2C01_088326 [Portunus trituberculatus]|uniref:Uncharacterized protein n=1 Tax=Portunus trituberculatus TaxID=210409 RepID=A0A5B7JFN8_PORTR|nr:hypothetical protein [Portunus trituberculatus]
MLVIIGCLITNGGREVVVVVVVVECGQRAVRFSGVSFIPSTSQSNPKEEIFFVNEQQVEGSVVAAVKMRVKSRSLVR